MRDLPSISIVMPSLNQAPFLRQAMESVLDQGYPDLEFGVVDGGSTDDSVSIIRSMEKHLSWWTSEKDDGQAAAVNKGFARTTGQILGWLNSDDYYLEDALFKVAEASRGNPSAGLFVGNGLRVDRRGKRIAPFAKIPILMDRHTLSYGIDYLLQPATFFSRSAWETSGGLREDLRWCFDWDLWIRIGSESKAVSVDALLAVSREHSETKTATGLFERWNEIRLVAESHTGMPLTPGALAYFLDTLHDYLRTDPQALRYMSGLSSATAKFWARVSHMSLKPLTGRVDGFPTVPPPTNPSSADLEEVRAELLRRQEAADRERKQRARTILDSLQRETTADGRVILDELAGYIDSIQEQLSEQASTLVEVETRLQQVIDQLEQHTKKLHALEDRLLVRAGKALRLI